MHTKFIKVVGVLLSRRVLRMQRVGGRRAMRNSVEVEGASPASLIEAWRDEAHLFGPLAEGRADRLATLDDPYAGGIEPKSVDQRDRLANACCTGTDNDDIGINV